jgi:hypothetical protein
VIEPAHQVALRAAVILLRQKLRDRSSFQVLNELSDRSVLRVLDAEVNTTRRDPARILIGQQDVSAGR